MTLPNELSFLDSAGRLLIVGFFLVAGLSNMTRERIREHIERMRANGMPAVAAAFWFGVVLQFCGCALLLAGWHADIGALLLIIFTVMLPLNLVFFFSLCPGKDLVTKLLALLEVVSRPRIQVLAKASVSRRDLLISSWLSSYRNYQ